MLRGKKCLLNSLILSSIVFLLSSCSITAEVFLGTSLEAPALISHLISEVNQQKVIIEVSGQCPPNSSVLNVTIGEKKPDVIAKSLKASADLNEGEVSYVCDSEKQLILRYALPDPNYSGPIKIGVSAVYETTESQYNYRIVEYSRPEVPRPLIWTNDGRDFYTNDDTPLLQGACISSRLTAIEYRVDGGSWQALSCMPGSLEDTWSLISGAILGIPATGHLFEVRGVNSNAVSQYSEVSSIKITVDQVPPGPPMALGVLGQSDSIIDEWLGALRPKVVWATDADHYQVEVGVYAIDRTTVVCAPKFVNPVGEYEFLPEDCEGTFVNGTSYALRLKGKDLAGNLSESPTWYTFTADLVAPSLSFSNVPLDSKSNFAELHFSASAGVGSPLVSTLQCSLDSEVFADCVSPVILDTLSVGIHKFSVRAFDVAGNSNTSVHTWNISEDFIAPLCAITSPDLNWINSSSANFAFTCSDDDGIRNVQCQIDGGSWQNCSTTTSESYTSLSAGIHTFSVRAIDNAGKVSSVVSDSFNVDQTNPIVTLTIVPPLETNQTSASFSFTAADAAAGISQIECSLDGSPYVSCASPYNIIGSLVEGAHSFVVRVTDNSGNSAMSTLYGWTVDLTPPNPPIVPADVDGSIRPTWTWSSGGNGGNGTFRYKLDDGDFSAGSTETTNLSYTPGIDLNYGSHALYVQERDNAGNWSNSSYQTITAKCSPGQYFDGGSCYVCAAGFYQTNFNLSPSCAAAGTGHFVSTIGATSQTACTNRPANSGVVTYGTSSALTTNACPILSVDSCEVNYVVNGLGCRLLCGAGTYWDSSSCVNVGLGYYSPIHDDSRYACPANSHTANDHAVSSSDCIADAGYYGCEDGICDNAGMGYYSDGTSNSRSACPLNSTTMGVNATSLSDCLGNAGYYNCEDGLCDPVGVGYYSAANSNSRSTCPLYRTTFTATSSVQTECLAIAGYYGSDASVPAEPVGAGYYSPLDNERYSCPAGTYGSSVTNTNSSCDGLCLAGYYCPPGSTTDQGAGACPAGYSCPTGTGSYLSNVCGTNQYAPSAAGSCLSCPADSATWGLSPEDHDSINDCLGNAGYYNCQSGVCDQAGFGYYSPAGNNSRTLCPAGTYGASATNSSSTCSGLCEPGYYCLSGVTSAQGTGVCNANSYSTGGATSASCTACPLHSSTQGTGAADRDSLNDCLGDAGYYDCEDGTCDEAGVGYFSAALSNLKTQCPVGSSTLTTRSSSLNECLGDVGIYSCEDGTCDSVGSGYYSPNSDNARYSCPVNSFTTGLGSGADSLEDCLAGVDYYDNDTNHLTAPVVVGNGAYSPYRDDTIYFCTNKPSHATSVIYSGSGSGSNNCPIASVLTCEVGYTPDGVSCSDNSPGALVFTNNSNAERNLVIESNALSVSGFDGPLSASCSGCSAIARNGVWTTGTSLSGFMPGDTIQLRTVSSSSYATDVIATVTLGVTTSSNWIVGTRAAYSCTGTSWGVLNHGDDRIGYLASAPVPPATCTSQTRTCNDGVLSGSYMSVSCSEGCLDTPWGNVANGYSNTAYSASASANCVANSETRSCANGTLSGSYTFTSCSDNTPDAITFTNQNNVALSSVTDSNAVTLSGFNTTETATCTGCLAIARNGVWGGTSVAGFVAGDTISIRLTSSGSYSTALSATVTVGGTVSPSWSVTTRAANNCTGTPWGTVNHGSSVTGYSATNPSPPTTCAGISQTRTCTDGVLSGSYTNASCSDGCTGTPWGSVASGYSNTAYSSASPTAACSTVSQTRTCTNGTMSGTYTNTSCTSGCTGTPWGSVASGYSNTAYSTSSPTGTCSGVSQTRTCTNGTMSGTYTNTTCSNGCTGTPWGSVASGYSNTAYSTSSPTGACSGVSQTRTCTNGTMSGTYTNTSCTSGCTGTPWGSVASGYSNTAYSTSSPTAACSTVSQTRTCTSGTMSGTYTNTTCSSGCTGTPWGSVASGYSNTAYQSSAPAGDCVGQTRTCTNGTMSGTYTATTCTPAVTVRYYPVFAAGKDLAKDGDFTTYASTTTSGGTQYSFDVYWNISKPAEYADRKITKIRYYAKIHMSSSYCGTASTVAATRWRVKVGASSFVNSWTASPALPETATGFPCNIAQVRDVTALVDIPVSTIYGTKLFDPLTTKMETSLSGYDHTTRAYEVFIEVTYQAL